jgi:hypothetical protein
VVLLVHLDELSNGKACSLDEVLVTPEIAFLTKVNGQIIDSPIAEEMLL